MSKYKDMCAACQGSVRNWTEYQQRTIARYVDMCKEFAQHCEIPDGRLSFHKKDEETRQGITITIPGATTFDESDGWFHFGLAIQLSKPEHFPPLRVLLDVCTQEAEDGGAKARIGDSLRLYGIQTAEDRCVLYDAMAQTVLEYFSGKGSSRRLERGEMLWVAYSSRENRREE